MIWSYGRAEDEFLGFFALRIATDAQSSGSDYITSFTQPGPVAYVYRAAILQFTEC
jgi:hypothetical protein